MNTALRSPQNAYRLDIQPLGGTVTAWRDGAILAQSDRAKVMYETRLPAVVYFPREDVVAPLGDPTALQTFCPFKGTATYRNLSWDGETIENAAWSYETPLPESEAVEGYVGFMPGVADRIDLGPNVLPEITDPNISGPSVDWLMREAGDCETPEAFTAALAEKLIEDGVSITRLSVMIWSLHPLIAGKNYIWSKSDGEVTTYAPSYEIYDHPSFTSSPLLHVSNGLGGVRQKLTEDYFEDRFPIMRDLRAKGATDYVAMPLEFSDGRTNVLTLTCDHPDGFTTANLGLIFECASVISRYYEVFTLKDNAQALLETYVGKRTGARVLGGEIRRGDGDEIDAAIMFCDLRGSTRLEETLPRPDYIALLNRFFETTSTLVHEHGGEVLKFIGDAVLAVFPADTDAEAARRRALASAKAIVDELDRGNHGEVGKCECAIGLAFGAVTYGNVGSRERLDFTVIGHAANVAARLGDHGKSHEHCIVATADIANADPDALPLGAVVLHNVSRPVESFAIPTQRNVAGAV